MKSKNSNSKRGRQKNVVRYGVLGLGHIAQVAVLPSFQHAKNSELRAIISTDETKLKRLGARYEVPLVVDFDQFEDFLRSGEIDALYIALPNYMHKDAVVAAAKAGIHCLCEKPMAMSEPDCLEMIEECEENNVKLMIAYRLHFQKAHREILEYVRAGKLGKIRFFSSIFSMQVTDPQNIRLMQESGGALYDIGIYCINAMRGLFQSEPEMVMATSATDPDDERFKDVDEMTSVSLQFPGDGLAQFICSFGATDSADFDIVGTKGRIHIQSAYEYTEPMTVTLWQGEREMVKTYPKSDQFAPELIHFSDCILNGKMPEPSGYEGLLDVRVMRAIEKSIRSRRAIYFSAFPGKKRGSSSKQLGQILQFPAIKKPKTIHVRSPHD